MVSWWEQTCCGITGWALRSGVGASRWKGRFDLSREEQTGSVRSRRTWGVNPRYGRIDQHAIAAAFLSDFRRSHPVDRLFAVTNDKHWRARFATKLPSALQRGTRDLSRCSNVPVSAYCHAF